VRDDEYLVNEIDQNASAKKVFSEFIPHATMSIAIGVPETNTQQIRFAHEHTGITIQGPAAVANTDINMEQMSNLPPFRIGL